MHTHGFAILNGSGGTSALAPAATASATCFRMRSALATLTTGPSVVLERVGSSSLNFYFRICKYVATHNTEAHLDKINELGDKVIIHGLVDVYALNAMSVAFITRKTHATSTAQQLCPALKNAPSTSSAAVYSISASART
jgi:hypothetical protein